MLVFDVAIQKFSIISGVYGPAQSCQKDIFWGHLRNLNSVIDNPWCIIGDFNELEHPDDKHGGAMLSPSRLIRLPGFLHSCHGVSVPVVGRSYTWKKRVHSHLVYEKFDRAIGCHDWFGQYPNSRVYTGPFTCSDHSYIMLDTDNIQFPMHKSLFRYHPHWSHYDDVRRLVQKNWNSRVSGTPMFRLTQKLHCIKRELKVWSKSKFSNFRHQVDKNTSRLHFVESKLITDPDNHRLNHWYFRLLRQREKLLLFHSRYWGQLARKRWLVDGDRNSRYFHRAANQRKRTNTILRLKSASGIWLDDPHSVSQQFIHDLSNRFTSSRGSYEVFQDTIVSSMVTPEENAALIKPVTKEEVHNAVFQMDPHKAPGSDGFGASFFQDHWAIIKDLLWVAIKDFFHSGKLLKEVNHTLITLIPKVANLSLIHI